MPSHTSPAPRRRFHTASLFCIALAAVFWALSPPAVANSPSDTAKKRAQQPKPKAKTTAGVRNKPPAHVKGTAIGNAQAVHQFADEVAERRGLDSRWVHKPLAQAQRVERVRELMRIVFSNALFPSRWHPERGARRA